VAARDRRMDDKFGCGKPRIVVAHGSVQVFESPADDEVADQAVT